MLPPVIHEDPITSALRRVLPALVPLFDIFGVPLAKRQEVIAKARVELVAKHPDLIHQADAWLVRRILRICTQDEAAIFWGNGEVPEELLFEDPPFFRKNPDRDRER
jgi:hypothetical protein